MPGDTPVVVSANSNVCSIRLESGTRGKDHNSLAVTSAFARGTRGTPGITEGGGGPPSQPRPALSDPIPKVWVWWLTEGECCQWYLKGHVRASLRLS